MQESTMIAPTEERDIYRRWSDQNADGDGNGESDPYSDDVEARGSDRYTGANGEHVRRHVGWRGYVQDYRYGCDWK